MSEKRHINDFINEINARSLNEGHKGSLSRGRPRKDVVADEIQNKLTPLITSKEYIEGTASDFDQLMQASRLWLSDEGWTNDEIRVWENESRFTRNINAARDFFIKRDKQNNG